MSDIAVLKAWKACLLHFYSLPVDFPRLTLYNEISQYTQEGYRMKYSVFYHHIYQAAEEKGCSIEAMLAEIRSWGIGYVELNRDAVGAEDTQIAGLAQLLAKHDLRPSSIYGFYNWNDGSLPDEDDLLLHQAELMGCGRVMVIPGFYTDLTDEDKCCTEKARMIAGMQRIVELAAAKSLTVTIECFDDARSPIATIKGMDDFLQVVPGLCVTLETGNFIFSGDDILEAQQAFRDKVYHVHLKDRILLSRSTDNASRKLLVGEPTTAVTGEVLYPCAVGQGHMPIARVIAELTRWDYDGVMTIEHYGVASYQEAIRASIDWLKTQEERA